MAFTFNENAHVLWVDFEANGQRLADPHEQERLISRAVDAGITHVVIDAKIPFGMTTYPSAYSGHVADWSNGWFTSWEKRDFLKEMTTLAKQNGLIVWANVNVFSEGTTLSKDGNAYDHPDWHVQFYSDAVASESNAAEYSDADTIFVNPINPDVMNQELNIIREVATYDIDGVVLDRCRYPNIYGDFSALSRQTFERYIGEKITTWPQDIMTLGADKSVQFGPYFAKWIEWRALNIKQFVQKARDVVKASGLTFANYTGSWYPLYFHEGVNWASETYKADYEWASETYGVSGLAEQLDVMMTGCYYPEVTISEARAHNRPADWYSVEGAIDLSLDVIQNATPYIGGLFLKDYTDQPEQFQRAIAMCKQKSRGVMLFDTIYLEQYGWWDVLKAALK
ncbi:alpha amylase family protein [Lentibacillus saliphilus]|uniref:alpha amylase family protein n=1 Tax=Lentibacillus saliphilus TaxID=2737028 RepID=UPI001C30DEB5|nr:alpha amylase family protein [Lentibacillus saliphilus]